MTDTSTVAGARQPPQPTTYNPIAAVAFPVGTPLTPTSLPGKVDLSDAGSILNSACCGVASTPGIAGSPVNVQYAGPISLTVEQWAVVTGDSDGLQSGSIYYVSDVTPGKLTFVRPTTPGRFVTQVGLATSPTDLLVQIGPTAQIV